MSLLCAIYFISGCIVVAEGLNKLERADLFDGRRGLLPRLGGLCQLLTPWRWKRERAVSVLSALGWAVLSIGGGGALAAPFLDLSRPSLHDVAVIAGCAVLIVRSRLREVA